MTKRSRFTYSLCQAFQYGSDFGLPDGAAVLGTALFWFDFAIFRPVMLFIRPSGATQERSDNWSEKKRRGGEEKKEEKEEERVSRAESGVGFVVGVARCW